MKQYMTAFALLFVQTFLLSQQAPKEIKVEISEVEIINGQQKRHDTSFTTTKMSDIKGLPQPPVLSMLPPEINTTNAMLIRHDTVILKNNIGSQIEIKDEVGANGTLKIMTLSIGDDVPFKQATDFQQLMNGAKIEADTMIGKTFIIKNIGKCDATKEEIENAKVDYVITITSKAVINDLSATEKSQLSKNGISSANNLTFAKDIVCSPNPAIGKFNLSFEVKNQATLIIDILSPNAVLEYHEELPNFKGTYSKEINTSQFTKGLHVIRITQGKQSALKKMVIE